MALFPKANSLSFQGRPLVSVLIALEGLLRMQQRWPGVVLNSSKDGAERSRNAMSPFLSWRRRSGLAGIDCDL